MIADVAFTTLRSDPVYTNRQLQSAQFSSDLDLFGPAAAAPNVWGSYHGPKTPIFANFGAL